MEPVIRIEEVLFTYPTPLGSQKIKDLFLRHAMRSSANDSLTRHIQIDRLHINKGEAIGVLGRNGSGKSTLLKLIAGILPPDAGSIKVSGKIAPLIEIGSVFDTNLTGEENANLYTAVLHKKKLDFTEHVNIAEWTELHENYWQPVTTYSSGMIAKLAFAIATYSDSDVVLVDETLSVGDESFQLKSMARMKNLLNRGTAVLLASHSFDHIRQFTHHSIVMHQGGIAFLGESELAIEHYLRSIQNHEH